MQKVNVKGALKLFTNEMSNGILPLTEETLSQLEVKHPDNGDASADVFINGPVKEIHPIVFEAIDEEMVLIAASITKGGSGSSGLDADGWKILSKDFAVRELILKINCWKLSLHVG